MGESLCVVEGKDGEVEGMPGFKDDGGPIWVIEVAGDSKISYS